MKQAEKETPEQVEYMNRWVDKESFRTYVYSKTDQKLADSYKEYEDLLMSGLWFTTKEDANKASAATPNKRKSRINLETNASSEPVQMNEFKSNKSTGL